MPFLAGKVDKSPRPGFIYWSDDGDCMAMRVGRFKIVFAEQRTKGLDVWREPLSVMRIPKFFDLRADPFERGEEAIGYIEVEIFDEGERLARHGGWADVGNLHVVQEYQRRGVATWLVGQAADWLELANVDRLLDYAYTEDQDETGQRYDGYRALLAACGFRELTRTRRGWTRAPRRSGNG